MGKYQGWASWRVEDAERQTKTPATPLPWGRDSRDLQIKGTGHVVADAVELSDAAYIVHAANAYPKLVEALRVTVSRGSRSFRFSKADIEALLRELGEEV